MAVGGTVLGGGTVTGERTGAEGGTVSGKDCDRREEWGRGKDCVREGLCQGRTV